jgi:HEAT repeat protein
MSLKAIKAIGLMKRITDRQPLYHGSAMPKEASSNKKSLSDVLSELEHHSTSSRGSAPAKEIDKAARILKSSGRATLENARVLLDIGTNTSIELALLILPVELNKDSNKVFDILIKYANHENWEIREYAGEMIGEFLRYHYSDYKKRLIHLRDSDSENIRRSVVIGLKYLGKYRELSLSKEILEILSLYMDDDSNYVKKNLGPFAIGDAMLDYDPTRTLAFLKEHASDDDPIVRWNVASAFSTAAGAKHHELGFELLRELILDNDKSVRQMALNSFRNIYKRNVPKRAAIKKFLLSVMEDTSLPQKYFSFLES